MRPFARSVNLGDKLKGLIGLPRHQPTALLRKVRLHFDFLLSRSDACVLQDFYDRKHFGNELVVFRAGSVAYRAVQDRRDYYVEAGPAGLTMSRWLNLPLLLKTLGAPNFDRTVTFDLVDAADLIKTYLQLIEEAFTPDHCAQTLAKYDAASREATASWLMKHSEARNPTSL